MVGIYKITNPEGKSYIGLSKDIEKRFKSHKTLQFKGNNKLKKSLIKYGWDFHVCEILEEINKFELNKSQLDVILRKRERYWINIYKTFDNGLNENKGGGGCVFHTSQSKQKIGKNQKNKSKPHTEEWNKNIGLSLLGKKQSIDTIEKRRISNSKAIIQYDLKDNFIKEWVSGKIAAKELNISYAGINNCCLGRIKSSGKFKWGFKTKMV
jgi:group I intron endonuclease